MMHAIRTISRRPSPGACLEDLLVSRFLSRRWASRIWSADELPARLERCARNLQPDSEWRAYDDDERIFFAIARAHLPDAPDVAPSAIDVYFLDDNASVYFAGVWEYDTSHGWWLDAILDLSYDCEHGWWLDGVMDTPQQNGPALALLPAAAGKRSHRLDKVKAKRELRPRRSVK